MSKSFTSRVLAIALFALAIAGCAGVSRDKPATPGVGARGIGSAALPDGPFDPNNAMPSGPPVSISGANERLWDRALEAIRGNDLLRAEVLLQEITEDQPELSGPWVNLGQVYAVMERGDEAQLAYLQAVKANPNNCVALNLLGVLSRKAGDFRSAEEHYLACVERAPYYKDTYLNLGILYELYLGKLEDALVSYRRYQELSGGEDQQVAGWVIDLERRLGV